MKTPKRSTDERLDAIETNQVLQVEALKLIMEELGIRKKLEEISARLEARNGAPPSSRMGSERR